MEPKNQPHMVVPVKKGKIARSRTHPGRAPDRDLDDRGATLITIELQRWTSIPAEVRKKELEVLSSRYHALLDELYNAANVCVERYQQFSKLHARWRRIIIIGTGFLAIINLIAARMTATQEAHSQANSMIALAAAGFAIVLTILANLESFGNSLEKAQAYRESRELFLDVAREFDRRWDIYVLPLAVDPEACVNAAELYRQVVTKDRDLRSKFKELTKTDAPGRKG